MSNVILSVKLKVKEDLVEEVYTFMKALVKLTKEEDKGCLQYDLHKVVGKNDEFCFIETWENQECLDEHCKKDHFINFMEYAEDKILEKEVSILEKYEEE